MYIKLRIVKPLLFISYGQKTQLVKTLASSYKGFNLKISKGLHFDHKTFEEVNDGDFT